MRNIKIKEFGENLVGVSFGGGKVSFLTYKENVKLIKEKLLKKESFSVKSLTGKDIVFTVSEHLCCYIVSDSHTGNTTSVYVD